MSRISKYNIPKKDLSGNSIVIINNGKDVLPKLERTTIFGLPFDGTNNVRGDITEAINITAEGDIKAKIRNGEGGNITADKVVTAPRGNFDNLTSSNGTINTISGQNLNYNTANLVNAVINQLQSTTATFDNLTVTKLAHFFKLIIDEMKSVGGNIIVSPSNAKFDIVERISAAYRCYFKATDGDKHISNNWAINDLVFCQTFNLNGNSNKYYWRQLLSLGSTEIKNTTYHYIDLSDNIKDGDSIPEKGDEVVLLGNLTDPDRQNAIIISAYQSVDTTVKPPSIVQYKGINDFSLERFKYNVTAANENIFRGNFFVENGQNLTELILSGENGKSPRITTDGYWEIYENGRWIKTTTKARGEKGDNGQNGVDGTNGVDGQKGEKGDAAITYKLINKFNNTKAEVDVNKRINLRVDLYTVKIEGNNTQNINFGVLEVAGEVLNASGNKFTLTKTITYSNQTSYTAVWKIRGVIVDTFTIPIVLAPSASFSITNEINSRVQSNKTKVDGLNAKTQTIENNLSTIRQTSEEITQRVEQLEIGKPNLISNDFFTQSDNHSGLSIVYSNGSFIMKQTQKLDIDFVNTPTRTQLEYGKKYLLSFIPITNGADVRFQILAQLSQNDRWWDNKKTIIGYNESSYYNNNLYSKVIEVTDPNKRYFSMYVESNWNEINKENSKLKQTTLPWTITLKDLRLTEISEKESIIAQKASKIELSVRDGLKKSGIDITSGQIDLNSENTQFKGLDGKTYIKISLDNLGMPHFIFYDKDGITPMYDLGYLGLQKLVGDSRDGSFTKYRFLNINNTRNDSATISNLLLKKPNNSGVIDAYKYTASYNPKLKTYGKDGEYNDYIYKLKGIIENNDWLGNNSYFLPNGKYITVEEQYLYYSPNLIDNDSSNEQIIQIRYTNVENGKIKKSGFIYIKKIGNRYDICTKGGIILDNYTYNYIWSYVEQT